MKPAIFVLAAYVVFGIWIYLMGSKGKSGQFKSEGAHILTVFPTKAVQSEYVDAYVKFHTRVAILSIVMGVFCLIIGRLLPIIFGSLVFFAYLNIYKYKSEEKMQLICEGENLA